MRVALLTSARGTSFCLLNNVSANGLQARIYGDVRRADQVTIDVPDENSFEGRIVWCRGGSVGVRLRRPIDPSTVLRLNYDEGAQKRRRLPRIQLSVRVTLKLGDLVYKGDLQDISNSGAMVTTAVAVSQAGPAILILPGLDPVNGQVRWQDGQRVGIFFNSPLPLQRLAAWLSDHLELDGPDLAACA